MPRWRGALGCFRIWTVLCWKGSSKETGRGLIRVPICGLMNSFSNFSSRWRTSRCYRPHTAVVAIRRTFRGSCHVRPSVAGRDKLSLDNKRALRGRFDLHSGHAYMPQAGCSSVFRSKWIGGYQKIDKPRMVFRTEVEMRWSRLESEPGCLLFKFVGWCNATARAFAIQISKLQPAFFVTSCKHRANELASQSQEAVRGRHRHTVLQNYQ
ncbi:hypothetical protein N658DRAFT_561768 [Parathielavia hyrcaniae]|uniref:Secreted protein n=1 Tax=Parathielavia hyrcaniae TaxID=113614 RepID=A0AAN6PWM1_9PEZI|nr:hypothetical protein N658DRAFT_561768 [Parathielavia hyrcaniae]